MMRLVSEVLGKMVNLRSWNCLGLSGWRPVARAILKGTQAPKEEPSLLPSACLRSSALLSEADLGAAGKGGEWPQPHVPTVTPPRSHHRFREQDHRTTHLQVPQLHSWVGKTCWRRDRLPTPVFLVQGQRHGHVGAVQLVPAPRQAAEAADAAHKDGGGQAGYCGGPGDSPGA